MPKADLMLTASWIAVQLLCLFTAIAVVLTLIALAVGRWGVALVMAAGTWFLIFITSLAYDLYKIETKKDA